MRKKIAALNNEGVNGFYTPFCRTNIKKKFSILIQSKICFLYFVTEFIT